MNTNTETQNNITWNELNLIIPTTYTDFICENKKNSNYNYLFELYNNKNLVGKSNELLLDMDYSGELFELDISLEKIIYIENSEPIICTKKIISKNWIGSITHKDFFYNNTQKSNTNTLLESLDSLDYLPNLTQKNIIFAPLHLLI
jgi:hypothetical protein